MLSCKTAVAQTVDKDESIFTELIVTEIKMQEGYYLIYANDSINSRRYKIISCSNRLCNTNYVCKSKIRKIEVGKIYKLKLSWASEPAPENRVANYLEFQRCITRFPLVKLCTEAGYELYESNNLKGLDLIY